MADSRQLASSFRDQLLEWYDHSSRPMPWKGEEDPYRIWISEIILQQTRVNQGWEYYEQFIVAFPNVQSLAAATEDEVLKQWEGLGYYSRARNLLVAANQVVDEHNGKLPQNYDGLLSLKGVGPYTASAIGSFAFGLPQAVVDGNVLRVLSRYFGEDTPVNSTGGKKLFNKLAKECLDSESSAKYNQAIIDFGATLCKPRQPECHNCPVSDQCVAYRSGRVAELPVKTQKAKRKLRFFHYFIVKDKDGQVLIRRRQANDVWKGLYEFPMVEAFPYKQPEAEVIQIAKSEPWWTATARLANGHSPVFRHELTHQRIYAVFRILNLEKSNITNLSENYKWVSEESLQDWAFPRLINRYFQDNSLSL